MRRASVVSFVVLATIVLGPATPASADIASGSRDTNVASNPNLDAYVTWNGATNQVQVAANLGTTMAAGYCFDSWFDWTTPERRSHFDARGARTCRNSVAMFSDYITEDYDVPGMQKAGGAYGPNNNTINAGIYRDAAGVDISINTINVNFSGNCSIRWWRRNADNTITTFSGGLPVSASCTG